MQDTIYVGRVADTTRAPYVVYSEIERAGPDMRWRQSLEGVLGYLQQVQVDVEKGAFVNGIPFHLHGLFGKEKIIKLSDDEWSQVAKGVTGH